MEYHFLHVMINNPPLECIYDVRTNISKIWADYYFQSVTLTNGTGMVLVLLCQIMFILKVNMSEKDINPISIRVGGPHNPDCLVRP